MHYTDPYAPIRPDQQTAIAALLASPPRPVSREARWRITRRLPTLQAGAADALLAWLRGEPVPQTVPLDQLPQPDADTRAANAAVRARLDAGFAGRAMQVVGLGKTNRY